MQSSWAVTVAVCASVASAHAASPAPSPAPAPNCQNVVQPSSEASRTEVSGSIADARWGLLDLARRAQERSQAITWHPTRGPVIHEATQALLTQSFQRGLLSPQEGAALQAVELALDRDRYRLQLQLWSQHAAQLCQIGERLKRGKVQEVARRQAAQALHQRDIAARNLDLAETRLTQVAGPGVAPAASLSALLLSGPTTEALRQAAASRLGGNNGVSDALQQADYQPSRDDQSSPQESRWSVGVNRTGTSDRYSHWNAVVTWSIPLNSTGFTPTALPRSGSGRPPGTPDSAPEGWREQMATVDSQAQAALTQARKVSAQLQTSDTYTHNLRTRWDHSKLADAGALITAQEKNLALRLAYVDALHDGQQAVALMWSLVGGVTLPLE